MNPVGTLETAKAANPLVQLQNFGQSIWLDYIRRDLLKDGELQRLIAEDGLRGMTSNPSIFEKAIADSTEYQDFLDSLAPRTDLDAKGRYEPVSYTHLDVYKRQRYCRGRTSKNFYEQSKRWRI